MDDQMKPPMPAEPETNNEPPTNSESTPTESAFVNEHATTVSTESPAPSSSPASSPAEPAAPSNEPVVSETLSAEAAPTLVTSNKPKSHKGLWLVVVLLIVVVAGAGAFLYQQKHKTTSKTVVVVTKKYDIPKLQLIDFSGTSADYYPNISNNGDQQMFNMQVFEGLTKMTNGTTLSPSLATSWSNPDQSTWVFKLQKNVHFHTGKLMTATDVKASIDAIMPTDYGKTYTSTIKEVTVVDANTVKITTVAPDPILANELAFVFIYDTTSGKQNDAINGTGPYTAAKTGSTDRNLIAVDNYWGGHVYTKAVEYLNYKDPSQVPDSVIASKKVGISDIFRDKSYGNKYVAVGYKVKPNQSYTGTMLVLNSQNTKSPLSNIKVRQAIAQAIDVDAYMKAGTVEGGDHASQPLANGIPGYNPELKPPVYDVAKAKAALAAAGYPNGFTVKFTYYSANQKIAESLQNSLKAVGVTVQLDPETDTNTFADIALGGKTDMFSITLSSGIADASDDINFFQDMPFYTSKTFDDQLTQASKTFDKAKRLVLLQAAEKTLMDDQAVVPLYENAIYNLVYLPNVHFTIDTGFSATIPTYFWQTYSTTPYTTQ